MSLCWPSQACLSSMPTIIFAVPHLHLLSELPLDRTKGHVFWCVFVPRDNATSLDSNPLCAMNIYFFARYLNSSAPKSVTHDLIKLHLITLGCPSGLTPSFPEEFSPDLLNSSKALSGRPPGAVPCACWVAGICTVF